MGRRAVVTAAACAMVAGVVGAAQGCFGATAIRVELTTNIACDQRPSTFIQTPNQDTGTTSCVVPATGGPARIGDIVIVPHDGADEGRVDVAMGLDGRQAQDCLREKVNLPLDCVVASRRFTFERHVVGRLEIHLSDKCRGKTCEDPNTTCFEGGCVDDETLTPSPRPPRDAAPVDGGADAEVPSPSLSCGKPGTGGLLFETERPSPPGILRHRDGRLYWADGNKGFSIRVDGTDAVAYEEPTAVGVTSIDAMGASVFAGTSNRLYRFQNDGGERTMCPAVSRDVTAVTAESATRVLVGTAVDGVGRMDPFCEIPTNVIPASQGDPAYIDRFDTGTVIALMSDADGGPKLVLAEGNGPGTAIGDVTAVVADGKTAFYAGALGTEIHRFPGGAKLYAAGGTTTAMAVDATHVYWLAQTSTQQLEIFRGPRGPGPSTKPEVLVDVGYHVGVAVDSKCLYYWSGGPKAGIFARTKAP